MTGRRTWLRTARLAATCALMLVAGSACTGSDQLGDPQSAARPPSPSTDPRPSGATGTGLETVAWSVLGGTVSVLVRNATDQVLRQADATLRALDSTGAELATSLPVLDQGACCSARNVPPGGTYGLAFPAGDQGGRIDGVRVDFFDVAWGAATGPAPPTVTATPVRLFSDETGAVAVVAVTARGPVDRVLVQARLDDAGGSFLVVASGTRTCLRPGGASRMFLQLHQPVPDGTTLVSVAVFAAGPATSCRSSPSERSWRARR